MKFIVTNVSTEESFEVTKECAVRVKGKSRINELVRKVKETGKPIGTHFEGEYDLDVVEGYDE